MVTLGNLYDMADSEGIDIINYSFSKTKKAVCMCTPVGRNIILDKAHIETKAEEKVILAEEISHYETNAFYTIRDNMNNHTARGNRLRQEAKAQHHSYLRVLPPDELQIYIRRMKSVNVYEVAEHFDVTVESVCRAMEYYETKGYCLW